MPGRLEAYPRWEAGVAAGVVAGGRSPMRHRCSWVVMEADSWAG
jgi:hypothetical protein